MNNIKNNHAEVTMKSGKILMLLIGAVTAAVCLNGCKSREDYKQERIEKAMEHYKQSRKTDLPADKLLTLNDCLQLAMKNNFEIKVQNLEREASKNAMIAELLGMLPDLSITDSYQYRFNKPGSSSKAVTSEGETYGASTSQDKGINNFSVDLAFSMLDCGLAFFNSQQGYDRMLMKEKQIARMRQNLRLEVTRAYFKVAASQRAVNVAGLPLMQLKIQIAAIEKLQQEKRLPSVKALQHLKTMYDIEKRLTLYTQDYEKNCMELRSLLGVYPNSSVLVDDTVLDHLPVMEFPDMETMEQMAILQRPELYEIDIQKHINIIECRKTILMMLPNVQFYGDLVNNNNSFLYHNTWWEMVIRAAYNALKTPQYIARYMSYSEQADVEELRAMAQAIIVMSQVRIAKADIAATRERYEIVEGEFRNFQTNLKKAEAAAKLARKNQPKYEMYLMRAMTAQAEIEKILSMSACHIANHRMLNAIGVEKDLDPATVKQLNQELSAGATRAKEELDKMQAEYTERQNQLEEARIAGVLLDAALSYYEKKNDMAAFEYFKRSAQKGNATAMFCLGKMYLSGKGIEQNSEEAVRWFTQAANADNPDAMMTLAWFYFRGENVQKDYDQAAAWYLKAMNQYEYQKETSVSPAQRELALQREYYAAYWLAEIRYRQEKYDEALTYYKNAARIRENDKMTIHAMVRIGCMYRDGKGSEGKNGKKAYKWFLEAAELKDPTAMNNIAMMYESGNGVPQSKKLADEWYDKYNKSVKK